PVRVVLVFDVISLPPRPTLFPYTTLFRSQCVLEAPAGDDQGLPGGAGGRAQLLGVGAEERQGGGGGVKPGGQARVGVGGEAVGRSEEHTSELQSRSDLVCRLLLEKKKTRV